MNEQLQQQLAEYLKAIATAAQHGAGFVMEQAPLVVQERLLFGRIVFSVPLILAAVVLPVAWKMSRPNRDDGGYIAVCAVAGLACLAVVFTFDLFVKVWFAPRLYILEWALSLVK